MIMKVTAELEAEPLLKVSQYQSGFFILFIIIYFSSDEIKNQFLLPCEFYCFLAFKCLDGRKQHLTPEKYVK